MADQQKAAQPEQPVEPGRPQQHEPNKLTRGGRVDHARPAAVLAARGRAWALGWWPLLTQTLSDWWEDRAPRLGAALAFYTVLSLAPLLVIVTPILGMVLRDPEAARRGISKQFEQLVGEEGAAAIQVMLEDPTVVRSIAGEEVAAEVAAATQASTRPATQPQTQPQTQPDAQLGPPPGTQPGAVPAGDEAAAPPATQPAIAEAPAATQPEEIEEGAAVPAPRKTAPEPSKSPWPGRFAWMLSIFVLAFGATNVFAELQDSFNTIWEVAPKPGRAAVWDFVRQRVLSFAMVMVIGFLLLVSLVLSAVLEALKSYFVNTNVGTEAEVWTLANTGVSLLVVTALFALMFKVLPDVRLRWRDVIVGAILTAGLFTVGRHLIGQYLGRVGVGERYGASRSMVALLVWVYYSAQILLLGAEFTKVWSRRHGVKVQPTENAVPITEEARAQQGIAHREVVEAVTEVVERKDVEGTGEPGKTIRLREGEEIKSCEPVGECEEPDDKP